MLKRRALAVLVGLLACDGSTTPDSAPSRPPPAHGYVAAYFEYEGRLVPEYHQLKGTEPPRAMWQLLAAGPDAETLTTGIDDAKDLVHVAEPEEGRLLLELAGTFWSRPDEVVYDAAAQIVYSMSSVEGGRFVTLIDGLRPGVVRAPDGDVLEQPLSQEDFRPPLVQVVQPVAGATVGTTIPVELALTPPRRVRVALVSEGKIVAVEAIRGGSGAVDAAEAPPGPATLRVEVTPEVVVEVPLVVAAD